MRIKQISVTGLFGMFDHVIPLNMEDRITIIHSPNGFGKTAILKLLNGLFKLRYLEELRTIPFHSFAVSFDDDSSIKVSKTFEDNENRDRDYKLTFSFISKNSEELISRFDHSATSKSLRFPFEQVEEIIPNFTRSKPSNWKDTPDEEFLGDVLDPLLPLRYVSNLESESIKTEKWLEDLMNSIDVRLIESQRLLNISYNRQSRRSLTQPKMRSTVDTYSDELAQNIQTKLAEYATISQSLDRTFPARVVKQRLSTHITDEYLRDKLKSLEHNRSRLVETGLLDKEEESGFRVQQQIDESTIDESTWGILAVYVEDAEKKLNVFEETANKIEVLREIINSRFKYKKMTVDKKAGFTFISENGNPLSPKDLSSGEQHELVLLYELLFKVKPKSLILIDEPELSLHVEWQVQFLKDLQNIIRLADLDVLIATHSPDLIHDRWDLTVELKGPAK